MVDDAGNGGADNTGKVLLIVVIVSVVLLNVAVCIFGWYYLTKHNKKKAKEEAIAMRRAMLQQESYILQPKTKKPNTSRMKSNIRERGERMQERLSTPPHKNRAKVQPVGNEIMPESQPKQSSTIV